MSAAAAVAFLITAYCPSVRCGAHDHGITTSGARAVEGHTVACPPELPLHTWLHIEGVGVRVCEDRGGDIVGARLDLFLGTTDEQQESDRGYKRARAWGRRTRAVRVLWRPGEDVPAPWGKVFAQNAGETQ